MIGAQTMGGRAPVCVVIPTYKRGEMVRDAIDSVLAQTLPAAQVIVVDDGSDDDTPQRLRDYGGRITYRYQPNAGLSAARNHGIRLATEPLVAFLDDDDVWHPRKLELQVRCMQQHPEIALTGTGQCDWPIARFPEIQEQPELALRPVTWEQLVVRTLVTICTVMVRRETLERVGSFDVTLPSSEDREFLLRVAETSRIGLLPLPLACIRDTAGSMCKNADAREQVMRRILRQIDQRGAWRGRRLLRRKAYSFMNNVCADAQARAGNHRGAVLRVARSMAWYPLPYRRDEACLRLERPRRMAVNLLRIAKLKRSDHEASAQRRRRVEAETNALRRGCAATAATLSVS